MALCTSSFEAETPRAIYRLSADIQSELPYRLKCGKVNIFGEINGTDCQGLYKFQEYRAALRDLLMLRYENSTFAERERREIIN